MNNLVETVEAIIFSAGKPVKKSEIMEKLPEDVSRKNLTDAIAKLEEKYSGKSGVLLLTFNDKLQFSSNPEYGAIVSEVLQPIKEKELSQSLLETLSIIAYKQPVTRLDIEEIRNVQSCDYQINMLLRAGLVQAVGRKDTVGRPTLYGTTDEFLKKFQLHTITDLPDYAAVMEKLKNKMDMFNYSSAGENLFREIVLPIEAQESSIPTMILDEFLKDEKPPDFLDGEDFNIVE